MFQYRSHWFFCRTFCTPLSTLGGCLRSVCKVQKVEGRKSRKTLTITNISNRIWDDLGMILGCFGDLFSAVPSARCWVIWKLRKKSYHENLAPHMLVNHFFNQQGVSITWKLVGPSAPHSSSCYSMDASLWNPSSNGLVVRPFFGYLTVCQMHWAWVCVDVPAKHDQQYCALCSAKCMGACPGAPTTSPP